MSDNKLSSARPDRQSVPSRPSIHFYEENDGLLKECADYHRTIIATSSSSFKLRVTSLIRHEDCILSWPLLFFYLFNKEAAAAAAAVARVKWRRKIEDEGASSGRSANGQYERVDES